MIMARQCNGLVEHVFEHEGVYLVSLTVIAGNGMMDLDTVKVEVKNTMPTAEAGEPVTVYEDEVVTFEGSAWDTAMDMATLEYRWYFGDGCSAEGRVVEHAYTKAGAYEAILEVRDGKGGVGRDTRHVTVLNAAPVADAGAEQSMEEGEAVYLDAGMSSDTPSDTALLRYAWSTGVMGKSTIFQAWENGVYYPEVTVTDDDGASSKASTAVHVTNAVPVAGITKAWIDVNITLRMAGEKWHDAVLWLNSTECIATLHVYREPGSPDEQSKSITLALDVSMVYNVTVLYTPEDDPVNGQCLGANPVWVILGFADGEEQIQHVFNVVHAESYRWQFALNPYLANHTARFAYFAFDPGSDDLYVETENQCFVHENPGNVHPFHVEGVFEHVYEQGEVMLTVTDDDGGTNTAEVTITSEYVVEGFAPCIEIGEDMSVEEYQEFMLCIEAEEHWALFWSFGDGYYDDEACVWHRYSYAGMYTVILYVYTADAVAVDYVNVTVNNVAPEVTATLPAEVEQGSVAVFTAEGMDTENDVLCLEYAWSFGDGSMGYGAEVEHVYAMPGMYTVTVKAIDDNYAMDEQSITIVVDNVEPGAMLNNRYVYGRAFSIEFTAIAYDAWCDALNLQYQWEFGDGTMGYGCVVEHTYTTAGEYTLTLRVSDGYATTETTAMVKVVMDRDGDGLTASAEEQHGTSDTNADTDYDHLLDYWEIYTFNTDPTRDDSDGDGLNDWYEVSYLGYEEDIDNDGATPPWDKDSDGDFVDDYTEVMRGAPWDPLVYNAEDGTPLTGWQVTLNPELGVSIAVSKPFNVFITLPEEHIPGLNAEFIQFHVEPDYNAPGYEEPYTAFIKARYDINSLPEDTHEYAFELFRYDHEKQQWMDLMEHTGVDMDAKYVWACVDALSDFGGSDSEREDTDEDGLNNYEEEHGLTRDNGAEAWNSAPGVLPWTLVMDDDEIGVARKADTHSRYYIMDKDLSILKCGGDRWESWRYATSIAFGNIDNDEMYEVGIARKSSDGARFYLLDDRNHGFRVLYKGGIIWDAEHYATSIAFGDVDGDGYDEVGIARKASSYARFYILNYDNGYPSYYTLPMNGSDWGSEHYATSIAFGDVDGDGYDEIGVARKAGTYARFYILDDAQEEFKLLGEEEGGADWGPSYYATDISFGDVDGDGKDEIGVARRGGSGARFYVLKYEDKEFKELHKGGTKWGSEYYPTDISFGDVDKIEAGIVGNTEVYANIPTCFHGFVNTPGTATFTWTWDMDINRDADNADHDYNPETGADNDGEVGGQYIMYAYKPVEGMSYPYNTALRLWVSDGGEGDIQSMDITVNLVTTNPNEEDTDGDGLKDGDEYFGVNGYITNPADPDTDGDGLKDGEEIEGIPRYVTEHDGQYIFHISEPAEYTKVFHYHTSPICPDTDLDGQPDSKDLVPLDYDMDGDGRINRGDLSNPDSPLYMERIDYALRFSGHTLEHVVIEGERVYIGDMDKDEDGRDDMWDDDQDNDGMCDIYEMDVGCTPYPYNTVDGLGWQHPFVYNARYALIVVGGGYKWQAAEEDDFLPAFWNDGMALYNKLKNNYKYLDENIYLMSSRWYAANEDGSYSWKGHNETTDDIVDGECTWMDDDSYDIYDALVEIGDKITVNDFFFLSIITHGLKLNFRIRKTFTELSKEEAVNNPSDQRGSIPHTDLQRELANNFGGITDPRKYGRMLIVIQACYAGNALPVLSGVQRIIICAAKAEEETWTTAYSIDHWAFMYHGNDGWNNYYPGFIKSMGSLDNPQSVLHMFYKGYDAAVYNKHASHPLLDDNGDGVGHEKGGTSKDEPYIDGYLSARTYL